MAGLARGVLDAARNHGIDLSDLLDRFAIAETTLDRADAFVPVELHEALWADLAARLERNDVGVLAAREFRPGLTGIIEYHLRTCATVGEAVAAWVRFAPIVSDQLSAALEHPAGSERATLYWRLARPLSDGTRHWAEFALGRAVRLIRDAVGEPIAPREVWFRHGAPADTTPHRHYFGGQVRFEQPEHALVFDAALLTQRIRGFDPIAQGALAERAETLRGELAPDFAEQCRATIRALLSEPRADASLARVAERLSLSARSLQRRLAESGLTFRGLSDEVREAEAQRLLARLPPHEVATRLGYADPAALRRARRRWLDRSATGPDLHDVPDPDTDDGAN